MDAVRYVGHYQIEGGRDRAGCPGSYWQQHGKAMILALVAAKEDDNFLSALTPQEQREILERVRTQAAAGDNISAKERNARDLFGAGWIVVEPGIPEQYLVRLRYNYAGGKPDAYHIPNIDVLKALTAHSGGHYFYQAPAGSNWVRTHCHVRGTLPAALGLLKPETTE